MLKGIGRGQDKVRVIQTMKIKGRKKSDFRVLVVHSRRLAG